MPSSANSSSTSRLATWFKLITVVLPAASWNAIRILPRVWLQKLSLRPAVVNGLIRSMLTHLSPQQLQALSVSSLDTYKAWIERTGQAKGFQGRVQATDGSRTNILWLEKAEKYERVILFFHGGGYIVPLSDGHLSWMAHMQEHLASEDVNVGVAVLEYSLVPAHPYPTQLSQAIDALQTLINAGFKMENIIIGGDSAGGHLTLSLLSHLNHPRTPDRLPSAVANSESTPEIKVPGGQKRLAAAFLVSPLCSVDITQPSYETRCNVDMLSKTAVHQTGEFLLSGSSAQTEQNLGQGWSMALDMRDEHVLGWWKGLDAVVSNVLITAGQEEALRDHCVQFADVLRNVERKGNGFNVKLLLQQDETHDAALFDFNAGRALSTSTKVIDRFVVDVFSRLK